MQRVPEQFAGEVEDAGAPSVLAGQFLYEFGHGRVLPDDVRFDFVSGTHF